MLRATIDADVFKEAVDAIAALVSECRLHVSPEGMRTRAVDTANVAMVSLELTPAAFETFEAAERPLGIDVTKLKNILGTIKGDDRLLLTVPADSQVLNLAFQSYRYSLTMLDPNTIRKDPNAPALELPGQVVLDGTTLANAIKAAGVVSDKIALGIDPEARVFYMEAEGDTENIRLELGAADLSGAGAAFGAVTQVGPMVTVLIVAGAGATAMCADLGSRTIREEIDAMEVLGINPVQRLVTPRMLAAGLVALLLNSLVVIIGILGGYVFSVFVQDVNPGAFAAGITLLTGVPELIISCVKAALFGLIAGMVACYRGLTISGGGAKAVGNAVNETVVYAFMALFVVNVVVTAIGIKMTVR